MSMASAYLYTVHTHLSAHLQLYHLDSVRNYRGLITLVKSIVK